MGKGPNKSQYWDEAAEVAVYVLEANWASLDQLREALATRREGRPAIGQMAVASNKLSTSQVSCVLREQADTEQSFGRIAVSMGLMQAHEVDELLIQQSGLTPSLSDVLVSQGVITPKQAATVWARIRNRLRSHLDAALTASSF